MSHKPKKIVAVSVKRISLEVAEIAGWLAARAVPIGRANDFLDDGRQGVDYDRINRGGNDSSGPERAAMRRPDEVGDMAGDFVTTLEQWQRDGRKLKRLAMNLKVEWTDDGKKAASFVAKQENGEGDCLNCGRYVPGTQVDRLRQDRCSACAMYWGRHNHETERPRALWGGDSIDDVCPNIRTDRGSDARCVLAVGHPEPCSWPERIVA